ncbi:MULTISPECIES: hypothetical protein [unclassified Acidisoma]|jgi:hypothetical protein|uniref:hypothetical protein n=1 Tax=unclassified Acidisoma TaxID=2634065 RepID=UPI00131D35BD|nr:MULTISPECIES: hypothetical protein [unclassified Acidisoma]
MAELIPAVMFYEDADHNSEETARLNFELMNRLGTLVPGSPAYNSVVAEAVVNVREPH